MDRSSQPSSPRLRLLVLPFLLWILPTPPIAVADQDVLIPNGDEFVVNATLPSLQGYPDVALGDDGFLVVWESLDQDGDGWGVFARPLGASGLPAGSDLQVNSAGLGQQIFPAVAGNGQGDFVVAWVAYGPTTTGADVWAQRMDAAGAKVGTEFQVNSFGTGDQENVDAAMATDGSFLIVWESDVQDGDEGGIYAQLYSAAGAELGSELRLNDTTAGDQNDPAVAALDSGFAVVWESDGFDGVDEGVVLQLLDGSAGFVGGEVQVNTHVFGDQEDPDVAALPGGAFAVVWEGSAQDGSGEGVFGQVYGQDGLEVGDEISLNVHTPGDQKNPRVTAVDDGTFLAAWESVAQASAGSGDDLYARRFDASGSALGDEVRLNTTLADDQDKVALAGAGGRVLATWRTFDNSGADVGGRRFEVALFADGFESGNLDAWSSSFP
ncbi:MAG: hypothetical protein AAGN66_30235 [Acidobacteriota bacterium]